MSKSRIFKVVVALTTQTYAGQRKLAGIFRFLSGKYLWNMTLLRSASELTADFIRQKDRETDGYLISLHESAEIRRMLVNTGKPIVFIDDIDLHSISHNQRASFLMTNQTSIGTTAANFLLSQPGVSTFAFVHAVGKPHWSVLRAEGFMRMLARRQRSVLVYDSKATSSDADALAAWIAALPKPAAIFAAFDDRAVSVISACRACGAKIPKDVIIIGAGDDELICNSSRPTLSSVNIPFEKHGFMAARELQAKMILPISRQKTLSVTNDFIISQRQTTVGKGVVSALVNDGLAFIAANATNGIRVPDVIRHLNVSRRLADLRFRQSTGKSILQTIIETRIGEAKRLLGTSSLSVADIAERCGFSSANYFKNVFVKTVGTSPRAYRKGSEQNDIVPLI